MRTALPPKSRKEDLALREEWLNTVTELKDQIKTWVYQEPGWSFTRTGQEKPIAETPLGAYTVEVWRIETPEGEVRWEPIARNYPGRGIVELYAWPTAYRVRLIQEDNTDAWRVLTDSGIYLRQPWDREHFVTLIRDLVRADDMIVAA